MHRNGFHNDEMISAARHGLHPPQTVLPDVEPLPPVMPEPGLTHQPGFWPGVTIGAGASLLLQVIVFAASTFFGRVG